MAYSLLMKAKALCATVLLVLALTSCGAGDSESGTKKLDTLHKESFEAIVGTWPLTVDTATPVCGTKNPASLGIQVGSVTYALNGTGKTWEHWRDLHAIWASDPQIPGAYINEGDLLDYTRRHCTG